VTRRTILVPLAAVAISLSAASVASATTPPDDDNTVTTVDHDDDDSDKTGLWGLLGLLGLAGLAGLKRRNDTTGVAYNTPVTGTAPKRADGATGSTTGH
jgi:MYXO-CTERM domain-containing protein